MKHFIVLYIVFVCINQNITSQHFMLKGKLSGFADGTKIILNPFLENMDVDRDNETTIILKDEKFEYSTVLEKPTKFSMRVRPQNMEKKADYEQLTFWAENSQMTLNGSKGSVFQSIIIGSSIQSNYYKYILSFAKYQNQRKLIIDSAMTLKHIPAIKKTEMKKQIWTLQEIIEDKKEEFIFNNPQYYCTAPEIIFTITFFPDKIDIKKLRSYYNELIPELKINTYGKQISSYLKNQTQAIKYPVLETGDFPSNFELKDLKNKTVRLSSIHCKVLLIDFWASGCSPCRKEHKNYVELYKDFKDYGFEIISISIDQSKKLLDKAIKEDNMTWICLWDEHKKVYRDVYKVTSIPANFLIVDGKIVSQTLRGKALREEIESQISLIKESSN